MNDLRSALQNAGFTEISSYIQSGNIILHAADNPEKVERKVRQVLKDSFGLEIKVFVQTRQQLISIVKNIPSRAPIEPSKLYITFLDTTPSNDTIETLKQLDFSPDWYVLKNTTLYFYLPGGAAKSKLSNSFFERKLNVLATGRNLNTINKLIELSQD